MNKLHSKKNLWPKIALIPASCAAVLSLVVCIAVFNPGGKNSPQAGSGNTGISTMMDTGNKNKDTTPGNTFSPDSQVLETWNVKSMDEVKKYMDGAALTPSYLPQGTKLKEILAAGKKAGEPISISMEFELNGRPFSITQDKGVTKKVVPVNSQEVDINGVKASIDSNEFGTNIRWYKGDFMYAVQGSLSKDEAIKVAKGLK